MPKTIQMPGVTACAIAECAYNSSKSCHAIAITIGDGNHPRCDTFFISPRHSGLKGMAGVGACKVSTCGHNKDFACGAKNIQVGAEKSQGKCMTFVAS